MRVRGELIVWEAAQELSERVVGERIFPSQDVAVGKYSEVPRAVRGRQGRDLRATGRAAGIAAGIARRRRRLGISREPCECRKIKRRTSGAATGRANRLLGISGLRQRRAGRGRTERARRTWCIGIERGIERIAAPRPGGSRRRRRRIGLCRLRLRRLRLHGLDGNARPRWRRAARRAFRHAILGVLLHAPELTFELLVTILQPAGAPSAPDRCCRTAAQGSRARFPAPPRSRRRKARQETRP